MSARSRTRWIIRKAVPLSAALGLCACDRAGIPDAQRVVGGDPEAGRAVIATIECGVCHIIPGVAGADGIVGPPLTRFARRQFIAGIAPNQPVVLVKWVRDAPAIAPDTGMPSLPLTEEQARNVAAYLYTLR